MGHSTPLLPEDVPGIDTDPTSLGDRPKGRRSGLKFASLPDIISCCCPSHVFRLPLHFALDFNKKIRRVSTRLHYNQRNVKLNVRHQVDGLFDLFQLKQGGLLRAFAGACRTLQEPVHDGGCLPQRRRTVVLGAVDMTRGTHSEHERTIDTVQKSLCSARRERATSDRLTRIEHI